VAEGVRLRRESEGMITKERKGIGKWRARISLKTGRKKRVDALGGGKKKIKGRGKKGPMH